MFIPIHTLDQGFPWALLIILFFSLAAASQRRGGGREQWKARMEEMRARHERREAEEQAFREQVTSALKKQNELAEKQLALLEKLTGGTPVTTETEE